MVLRALNVTPARINEIVRERRGISADTALRLARFFNTSHHFWINLQANYEVQFAEDAAGKAISHQITHRGSGRRYIEHSAGSDRDHRRSGLIRTPNTSRKHRSVDVAGQCHRLSYARAHAPLLVQLLLFDARPANRPV